MTMTIEIIQLNFNNNLVKVQKKVQCVLFFFRVALAAYNARRERSATIFGVTASSTLLVFFFILVLSSTRHWSWIVIRVFRACYEAKCKRWARTAYEFTIRSSIDERWKKKELYSKRMKSIDEKHSLEIKRKTREKKHGQYILRKSNGKFLLVQDRVQNRSTIIVSMVYSFGTKYIWWALSFTLSSLCTFLRRREHSSNNFFWHSVILCPFRPLTVLFKRKST